MPPSAISRPPTPRAGDGHPSTKFAPNAVIAQEGDPGVGWYVLLTGRVGVFKGELKVAEFAQRGMVFGEISSIVNRPRTASLIALEPTELVYVRATLDELIETHPHIVKKILISLAERLAATTAALWSANEKSPG